VEYGLTCIVYGHSKRGKSWLGDTAPGPRVVLDAEAGSRFTPSKKVQWNPANAPPEPSGSWDTAIVPVRQFRDVTTAFQWLNSGKHPFKSVIIDSISEVQQRAVDDIAGTNAMKLADWGQLIRIVSDVVRKFRDLVTHPTNPLDAVVFIAMAKQRQDGVWAPYIQGSLSTTLPYYVDAVSYLDIYPQEDGTVIRRLFTGNVPGFETGERVGGRLGQYIDDPNISSMVDLVRGKE
jgi:AAA domain